MYDYMEALHGKFSETLRHVEVLKNRTDDADKQLLRLVDLKGALRDQKCPGLDFV